MHGSIQWVVFPSKNRDADVYRSISPSLPLLTSLLINLPTEHQFSLNREMPRMCKLTAQDVNNEGCETPSDDKGGYEYACHHFVAAAVAAATRELRGVVVALEVVLAWKFHVGKGIWKAQQSESPRC